MKIAFLTPEFPHPKTGNSGGIGTSIMNLANGLIKLNHQVHIVVYGQNCDEFFEEKGICYYKVKNIKFKGLSLFLTQKKVQHLLNHLVDTNKIDVVEAVDWTGFSSFLSLKCPLVLKLHGSDAYFCTLENRNPKWHNFFLEKKAFQKASAITSVSQFTGHQTNNIFNLNRSFTVIPNGVNVHFFQNSAIEADTNSPLNILYFGSLIRKKGLLELPLIFNKIIELQPDAQLILIGKDVSDAISGEKSTFEMMENLFSAAALKSVTYLKQVDYSEIKKYIQKATVCVFPSFAEAFPVSWLEAMALQKPIVASNGGWAAEVLDNHESGILIDPKNHTDFALAICAVLSNKKLQNQLGTKAQLKVNQCFTSTLVAQKNAAVYAALIEKKS